MSSATDPTLRWDAARSDPREDARADGDDRSVGELFSQVANDLGGLLSSQIELAKAELREDAVRAGKAAKLLSAGAGVAALTAVLLSFAAAWAIGEGLDSPALGFLIVGVLYGAVAVVLFLRGRDRLREVTGIAPQTVETLKDDARWAKAQVH
jgi:uncharacterized membrane protein YqjE